MRQLTGKQKRLENKLKDVSASLLDRPVEDWERTFAFHWESKQDNLYNIKVFGAQIFYEGRNLFSLEDAMRKAKILITMRLWSYIQYIVERKPEIMKEDQIELRNLWAIHVGQYLMNKEEWIKSAALFTVKYPVLHSKDRKRFKLLVDRLFKHFIDKGMIEITPQSNPECLFT